LEEFLGQRDDDARGPPPSCLIRPSKGQPNVRGRPATVQMQYVRFRHLYGDPRHAMPIP
jgi:hypothetical protein